MTYETPTITETIDLNGALQGDFVFSRVVCVTEQCELP
jgi:hypothetical protein